jgi:C4-dicarboxylate-specific signal transduction histidine kinase
MSLTAFTNRPAGWTIAAETSGEDRRRMSATVLIASIAHEVNQPLTGIVTNASTCLRMLAADPPNLEGARETARRALRDGNRAADLLGRLRTMYAGGQLACEPLDLNQVTREVLADAASELEAARVTVETRLAADLPFITGDAVALRQVLFNLVRNAVEAMSGTKDRPRHLLIRTERDHGGGVRVTVRDTGTGFAPGYGAALFEPFYTTKPRGMGIGLFVSQAIVHGHNGRLRAEPNDGPGATFSFTIPSTTSPDLLPLPVSSGTAAMQA